MRLRHIPRDLSRYVRHRIIGIPEKTYWQKRQRLLYLRQVRRLVDERAVGARSILDVGSNGSAYLDWFPSIPHRVSLDIDTPYFGDGVESIKADFLTYQLPEPFDIVLCLQVLEHIPDAAAFAQRLLSSASRHVIVSVPYKWPKELCHWHVHDPVDEAKLAAWFGREPTHSRVVREGRGAERIVCCYSQE